VSTHSLYVDKFTRLLYLQAGNTGC